MKIAIIGAGYVGMTAAYDLASAGHQVTVYEAAKEAGGLASGFKAAHWDWTLEKFYHHIFVSDKPILGLAEEIGAGDIMRAYSPSTDFVYKDTPYPFDSPMAVLTYPGLSLIDKLRAGGAVAYMKVNSNWKQFDGITAHEWLGKVMGGAYDKEFEPLLRGKFSEAYYKTVPMTWFWARMYARTPKLIYPDGGFISFTNALEAAGTKKGVTYRFNTAIRQISENEGSWQVTTADSTAAFDRVLVTVGPPLLTKMVPQLPESYTKGVRDLKHLGAVVMTVTLKQQLTKKSYWLNLDKRKFPMLCLVEHTNMVDKAHYGGDHIIYMGDYLDPQHPYLSYTADQLFEVYEPALKRFNPNYDRSWVKDKWLFSAAYAQPVPTLHHAEKIPALETPLNGLYFASMSQVYPWDRGTNFAVEIGRRVAHDILSSAPTA